MKNAFLRFEIPYADNTGKERRYQPDFIVRATDGKKQPLMLIVEITGMKRDKAEKEWSVVHRWLPAVNAVRAKHDWPSLVSILGKANRAIAGFDGILYGIPKLCSFIHAFTGEPFFELPATVAAITASSWTVGSPAA